MPSNYYVSDEVFRIYRNALFNAQDGNPQPLKDFKLFYPIEYSLITRSYAKRVKLKECVNALTDIGEKVYFGTLTFDDKHYTDVSNMRKQALRHLNTCFSAFVFVEEYGSENGRYHIHFIGALKRTKTFNDFKHWHSRNNLKELKDIGKAIHYLTDYTTKQAPRIRKSKNMLKLTELNRKARKWSNYGFDNFTDSIHGEMKIQIESASID